MKPIESPAVPAASMTHGQLQMHNNAEYIASEKSMTGLQIGQPIALDTLQRLRQWLSRHHPDQGSRLPSERSLAQTLSISRPELRKALMLLEAEGRITRHVGRGTFVSSAPVTALPAQMVNALADRTSPHEAMIARLALEPQLAGLAALHASAIQISRAEQLCRDMRATRSWSEYERLDHQFHDLIAQAAGNSLLHELHKVMNSVRQTVVWRQLSTERAGPAMDYHSFDEHDAIVRALARRERHAAKKAMQIHLTSTLTAMTSGDI